MDAGKAQRRKQRAERSALRKAIASGEVDLDMGEAAEVTAGSKAQPEPAAAAAANTMQE
jgi:hypothetical protein